MLSFVDRAPHRGNGYLNELESLQLPDTDKHTNFHFASQDFTAGVMKGCASAVRAWLPLYVLHSAHPRVLC